MLRAGPVDTLVGWRDEAEVALMLHAQVDYGHGYGDECDLDWNGEPGGK